MNNQSRQSSTLIRLKWYVLSGLLGGGLLCLLLLVQQNQAVVTAYDGWSFLYQLFWRSFWSLIVVAATLISAELLSRRHALFPRPGYGLLLLISLSSIAIISLVTASFQLVYNYVLNPNYGDLLREQAAHSLAKQGWTTPQIQTLVAQAYLPQQLFTDTLLYFFFLGFFVALMVAAYYYKRPIRTKPQPIETS